jgi:hypothetical protein
VTPTTDLVELVRKHNVRWEVWPEKRVFDGEIRQVGFEIDLIGDHDHPRHRTFPGCDECVIVHRALRRIADYLLPKGERASRYEIEYWNGSMRYPKDSREDGYVQLTIRILHRVERSDPPDDCQRQCLAEMERKLGALGARPLSRRHSARAVGIVLP